MPLKLPPSSFLHETATLGFLAVLLDDVDGLEKTRSKARRGVVDADISLLLRKKNLCGEFSHSKLKKFSALELVETGADWQCSS